MRHPRVGAFLAAAALATSACSSTQPGTAAYVGDATVSVQRLQSQVDAVLAYRSGPANADVRSRLPMITQQVLGQDVLGGLIDAALARTNFAVNEQEISTQLASVDASTVLGQPAQTYLTPDSLTALVRDQLVLVQLGRQAWDGLSITVDLVTATDRADASAKAQRMAVGDAESAAVVQEAVAAQRQATSGLVLNPAEAPSLTATPVFATPAGSALAFALQGKQWYAARIVSRSTDSAPSTAANAVAAAQAPVANTLSLGLSLLPRLAGDPQVRLNPRYGQWDPSAARVIANSDVPSAVVVGATG